MINIKDLSLVVLFGCVFLPSAQAAERSQPMQEDKQHIKTWNQFFTDLVTLHQKRIAGKSIRTTEQIDGYFREPDFYREVKYYDADSGQLLSKIQWEVASPKTIHSIEVYFYDEQGKLSHDYLAAFLPVYRNAPIQTAVTFYNHSDEIKAFRQFDASGERIYEQCTGTHFTDDIDISLEDYQLSPFAPNKPAIMSSEAYTACFADLQIEAGHYLQPLILVETQQVKHANTENMFAEDQVYTTLARLGRAIKASPDNAQNYLLRGRANFVIHDFHQATADLSKAIQLDTTLDQAWFWRGMSRGRQGLITEGINDLNVYLQRQPESSLGYTKRGVRYIWNGNLSAAESDLRKAIQIKPDNAEANDDLGVLLSQQGKYAEAVSHFLTTINTDPSYQKAYHNLAVVHQITGKSEKALERIQQALSLSPNNRNSLLLKSEILVALGQQGQARALREQAEFLPEGNWSERMGIK